MVVMESTVPLFGLEMSVLTSVEYEQTKGVLRYSLILIIRRYKVHLILPG